MTTERDLVQQLANRGSVLDALRGLAGGVSATQLRRAQLSDAAFDALVAGLADPNPRVRWWCIQVLDHVPDPRALAAIVPLLDDPVARVRRNAAHALGCVACKPSWESGCDAPGHADILAALRRVADTDPNAKVRDEATRALAATA